MKYVSVLLSMLLAVSVTSGCKKTPVEQPKPDQPAQTAAVEEKTVTEEAQPAAPVAKEEKLVPIPLEIPSPMFVGTPENLSDVTNLEKPRVGPRPEFLAPEGTVNLALNKPVTSSEMDPISGSLDMIVDGNKEATEGNVVELGPFEQWVVIDLEKDANIYAVAVWHYHKTPRVYFDIVAQVSEDKDFTNPTIIFNNDDDNSLGLGKGTDMNYVEAAEGKLIDAKGVKGRYVRLYSQANNQNDYSHYIEVEVYGK